GLHGYFVPQIRVFDVLYDSDNLHVGFGARVASESDVKSNRVPAGEELTGKGFIDNDGCRRKIIGIGTVFYALHILHREIAAHNDRNSKRREIIWADGVHERLWALSRFRRIAFNRYRRIPLIVLQYPH